MHGALLNDVECAWSMRGNIVDELIDRTTRSYRLSCFSKPIFFYKTYQTCVLSAHMLLNPIEATKTN